MNIYILDRLGKYYKKYVMVADLANEIWIQCFDHNICHKYVRTDQIKKDIIEKCRVYDDQISKCPIDHQFAIFLNYTSMGFWKNKEDIRYFIRIAEHPEEAEDELDRNYAFPLKRLKEIMTWEHNPSADIFIGTIQSLLQILYLGMTNMSVQKRYECDCSVEQILFNHFMKYHLGILVPPDSFIPTK